MRKLSSVIGICFLVVAVSCEKYGDFSRTIRKKEVPVDGSPITSAVLPLSRYGRIPQVVLVGNKDNSFDIAWLDNGTRLISISCFDARGRLKQTVTPTFIGTTNILLGFTKVTSDGSYVIGYSKTNASGYPDNEFWITRFTGGDSMIFNTHIFGAQPNSEIGSKGTPGQSSSSRIAYNEMNQRICFYLGHGLRTSIPGQCSADGRHQAGYIGFLDLDGRVVNSCNGWYISHNFDQRVLVNDRTYYTLSHGDGYPRALVFSEWSDGEGASYPLFETEYFPITGEIGDNTTNTETGGFVRMPDGNTGIVFASSIGRTKRDLCFVKISPSGQMLETKWLTQNATSDAINPRIAVRDGNLVIGWIDFTYLGSRTCFMDLDLKGEILDDKTVVDDIDLPFGDFIMLPNGDIIWALAKAAKTLTIYRLPG